MINSVSFFGQIKSQNVPKQTEFHTKPLANDVFIRTKNPLDESLTYAKNKIREILATTHTEYGIAIAPDGTILDEDQGNEHQCTVHTQKLVPNAILLHGHPDPLPLSSGDIAVLLATDAKVEEAIMKDGKFSRMSKKAPLRQTMDYQDLYCSLEKQLRTMAMDELGIDYKINTQDLLQMFQDFLEYNTGIKRDSIGEDELLKIMPKYGYRINEDSNDTVFTQLKEAMWYPLLMNPRKYDKADRQIVENKDAIESFLNSEDGIKLRSKFLEQVAQNYDLEYETNLFE